MSPQAVPRRGPDLAKGLIAAGIQHGERIAIMSATRYEWTLADYAGWFVGATVVPIYETSSAEQVEWILSNADCVGVFLEGEAQEGLRGGRRQGPRKARVGLR